VATETRKPGTVVQAWVPPALAAQIKARAVDERRSISAVIRLALKTKSLGDVWVRRFEC
jgi:hypothetical protein